MISGTNATRVKISCVDPAGTPSMAAVPLRERARPIKIRIVVVLPAPLGPRNPQIAPRGTVNVEITRAVQLGEVLHLDRCRCR